MRGEMKPDSDADDRPSPYVIVDVDYVNGAFVLVMRNVGERPAFQPRVGFSRKLVGVGGDVIVSELPIWSQLGLLAPGNSVRVFLDSAALVFRRKGSKRFRATVTYEDDAGLAHKRSYDHDLEAFQGLPQIEPD